VSALGLASDETLVSLESSPLVLPADPPPLEEILLRMAGVETVAELGSRGPLIASAANDENAANPELRRYEAVFARDAFYAAEFLSDRFPQLEAGTVRYFARHQATEYDPSRRAEPGKIAHHIRDPDDPLARRLTAETGRQWPWYGATDATPQFLLAACRLAEREPIGPLEASIQAAARWVLASLRDGLLWAGLNDRDSFTVWTDSPNAFHHRDGTLARPPVAPVYLQALTYDALLAAADIVPDAEQAARALRQAFLERFVVDGFLANGLDCDGRPLAVRTVNMGFPLDSAILDGTDLPEALATELFTPAMLTPFGFAGRARDELRFAPFDYHAQVWGFATHKVARGLARHGFGDLAADANARLLAQTRDGLAPENVGALDELRYCPHILTVRRPAPDGRETVTVKERPPAPYAAWTVAAVLTN
jgi:glycogen debranching enzyme